MASSNKRDRILLLTAGIGLAASLLLAAWLLGYFERDDLMSDDPAIADLQRTMQGPGKVDIPRLKQKYKELTPEQRREFDRRKMLMSLPKQEQKLRNFFALPEAEQQKQIDREIDAMEAKRRQASAGSSPKGADAGPKGGKPSGHDANPQQIMERKQEWASNASPELRSMMDRRIQMLNERREQRGLGPL